MSGSVVRVISMLIKICSFQTWSFTFPSVWNRNLDKVSWTGRLTSYWVYASAKIFKVIIPETEAPQLGKTEAERAEEIATRCDQDKKKRLSLVTFWRLCVLYLDFINKLGKNGKKGLSEIDFFSSLCGFWYRSDYSGANVAALSVHLYLALAPLLLFDFSSHEFFEIKKRKHKELFGNLNWESGSLKTWQSALHILSFLFRPRWSFQHLFPVPLQSFLLCLTWP